MVDTYPYDITTVVVNTRAGQVSPEKDFEVVEVMKKTGAGTDYAAGDILAETAASGYYETAAASVPGPFAVVNTPCLTTDAKANAIVAGWVVVKAGGAIKPGNPVKAGGTNKVIAYDPAAGGALATHIFGTYMYKAGQDDITHAATDAADNDLIIVKMHR